jgi:Protein of unknown function (DUF2911)
MKNILEFFFVFLIINVAVAQHENHQSTVADSTKPKPKSPRLTAMAMIGSNHVHIDYGSPSVRGRKIWNGLVAYDQVWATGAHKATWVDFGQEVTINGQTVPKGKYGFFTIPGKKSWTLILNKNWDMHLADDYKPENDLIRIIVKLKKNKSKVEAMTFEVLEKGKNAGEIKLSWDMLNVIMPFKNK